MLLRLYTMKINKKAYLCNFRKASQLSIYELLNDHKSFSSRIVDALCHKRWNESNLYSNSNSKKNPFVMCLPPPNITGNLHMGHALALTIEDVIARWHRMLGYNVVWVPGLDHAGIATQVVVERKLYEDKKMTRHEIGREAFLDEVWKWKSLKENEIKNQLNALGLSLDWSREFFTLSPNLNQSVNEAFVRLYDRGLIYRDLRLINWSCQLKSTISDIEVDMKKITSSTSISVPGYSKPVNVGVLHTFSYPLLAPTDGCGFIDVATTRLETMLGDTAVAVHPDDHRYVHLIGQKVLHPFIAGRELPIIADTSVDPGVGTGAVKLTPAHSPIDFELSRKHNLDLINIITDDGHICNTTEQFDGLHRFDARERVHAALVSLRLYKGYSTDHQMVLPLCSRSGDIVEYLIKDQWFIKCQQIANKILKAIDEGVVQLNPVSSRTILSQWLSESTDWCISRQLWWGHRIPAYRLINKNKVDNRKSTSEWIIAASRSEAETKAANILGIGVSELERDDLVQDEDVLDTWFSSSLLPFSIFGWPKQNEDLKRFYPNQMLETGQDILYFWVARMMMMGIELTGQLPFSEVYLHGIICDKTGRKMSKSEGNVIDPMSLISGVGKFDKKQLSEEVDCFGADALRLALLNYNSSAQQIPFNDMDVLSSVKFCNKMWQTVRFVKFHYKMEFDSLIDPDTSSCFNWSLEEKTAWLNTNWESLCDTNRWIVNLMQQNVHKCSAAFNQRNFHIIAKDLRSFWWFNLCDVYLEFVKRRVKTCPPRERLGDAVTLLTVIETALRLLHPAMPHITEVLWLTLFTRGEAVEKEEAPSLLLETMPTVDNFIFPISRSEGNALLGRMDELFHIGRIINELKLILHGSSKSMLLRITNEDSADVDVMSGDQIDLLKCLTRLNRDDGFTSNDSIIVNFDHGISLLVDQQQCNHLKALENLQNRLTKQTERRQSICNKLTSVTSPSQEDRIKTKISGLDEQIVTLKEKIDLIRKHFVKSSSTVETVKSFRT